MKFLVPLLIASLFVNKVDSGLSFIYTTKSIPFFDSIFHCDSSEPDAMNSSLSIKRVEKNPSQENKKMQLRILFFVVMNSFLSIKRAEKNASQENNKLFNIFESEMTNHAFSRTI